MWILYGIMVFSILLIVNGICQLSITPKKQALSRHHDLSAQLHRRGTDTASLITAKECYALLLSSYNEIKDYASASDRKCFEDDLSEIQQAAEDLAEEKWEQKAARYLDVISEALELMGSVDFNNVEQAYSSKDRIMKAYDALLNWTAECHNDNREIWSRVSLWDRVKECIACLFTDVGDFTFWSDPQFGDKSVRRQIEDHLCRQIESMRPEYKRKMRLRSCILQSVSDLNTIQRSVLLQQCFDGFVESEVRACYKGLVKECSLIETKQGNRYFVSLSDAVQKKYPPQIKEKPRPVDSGAAERENTMIEARGTLIHDALIRHLNDEQVEYVDKTASGGSLYFFSEAVANGLKEKGYQVHYAKKGTKGTNHRPAWYIKP